jgi:hypothetical protein
MERCSSTATITQQHNNLATHQLATQQHNNLQQHNNAQQRNNTTSTTNARFKQITTA